MRKLTLAFVLLYCNTASAGIVIAETGKFPGKVATTILDSIQQWIQTLTTLIS